MKYNLFISLVLVFLIFTGYTQNTSKLNSSQNKPQQTVVHPSQIATPVFFGTSSPLKDAPIVTESSSTDKDVEFNSYEDRQINPDIKPPDFENMPADPSVQKEYGWIKTGTKGIFKNFEGQSTGSNPPDCNGTVNEDYYFQVVNTTYQIFDKTDNSSVAGPSPLNSIFDGTLSGADRNDGDPIVLWDEHANKWLYAEFSVPSMSGNGNDYMLIAVSTTADPTGTWWSWAFDVDDAPDYMKFGIWRDGYYMATNTSNGNDVYVFERDVMITGGANPKMIAFDNPNRPNTFDGFHCILPLDNDGPWAPAGTPGQFITIADDGQNNAADELRIYELHTDWQTPANSTFSMTQQLAVNSFSGNFSNNWENISQPGTNQKLDAVSTVLMYRAQYRNFNGTQKIVCNHTIVDPNAPSESAIRWYELENTNNSWNIRQQSTYKPDNVSRWNGSIAMNSNKEIGLGFSVSDDNNTYPGIRYCGQSANAPLNTLDIAETIIWNGTNSQTSSERWGDYSNISVDPSDGVTFWYTNEYKSSTSHGSRIAAFDFNPNHCEPCSSSGTTTYNTSTTFVGFNTINNSSAKPSGYSDYTNISTDVKIGNTYNLNVKVNTDGDYTAYTKVWIDWNNNCSFDDAGEEYDLGTAKNVTNGLTSNSPLAITIPDDSITQITMRVSTKYNSAATSCQQNFDGEVEDYTINIKPGETIWIGNTTDWMTSNNWSINKVPTKNYIITIPKTPTGGNFPVINTSVNAKCYDLLLDTNSTITINGKLEILH